MRNAIRVVFAAGMILTGAAVSPGWGQTRGPTITHEPITVAARGQAISILARVRTGSAPIKTVTLYYTPSRDSSPIAQPMTPTGGEVYVGTIPTTYITSSPSVHYYLEAVDMQDEWAETQWTQVQIRDARTPEGPTAVDRSPTATPSGVATPVAGSRARSGDGGGLSTGAMIGGGVLAAGAAVAIIAAAGSGGGGGGGGTTDGGTTNGGTTNGGGGGGDTNTTVECTADDAVGTWSGIPSAPGFILSVDGRAQFFATVNGVPDEGSYGLVDCTLTLTPFSNEVYRGSGELSADKSAVTINGVTFNKL